MKFILLLIILSFTSILSMAQIQNPLALTEKVIRSHPDLLNDPQAQQDLLQKAEFLLRHPIGINQSSIHELMEIPLIELKDVNLIFEHHKKYGDFLCKEELVAVENLDVNHAKWIAQFIYIEKKQIHSFNSADAYQGNKFEMSLTRIINTENKTSFAKQPFHDMLRMNYHVSQNWQLGFNFENDAGELYQPLSKGLFDYRSFFICYKAPTRLKILTIGDYRLNYGQGLAMGNGFSPGKGAMVLQAIRFNQGISRFNSYNEMGFFRGIAASYDLKFAQLDVFYSNKKKDATFNIDAAEMGSLIESGLHRTESEIESKNRVNEQIYGARLAFQFKGWKAGLMAFYRNLNPAITPKSKQLYQLKNQDESNIHVVSADFKYQYKNTLMASEWSIAGLDAYAFQLCAVTALHSKLDAVMLARVYSPTYSNPFANGMHEWSNQNEKGFYTGLVYQLHKTTSLSFYADYFFSDWIRFRFPAIKWGMDQFAEFKYELKSGLKATCRLRKNIGEEFEMEKLQAVQKWIYRAQLQWKYNDQLELMLRWEQNDLKSLKTNSSGIFVQELEWKRPNSGFQLRHYVFYANEGALPIYATESELSGVFGLKSFRGNGMSSYIIYKQRFSKHIQLGLKYAYLLEEKSQRLEHELKMQLKISL